MDRASFIEDHTCTHEEIFGFADRIADGLSYFGIPFSREDKVLDAGAGMGRLVNYLRFEGFDATGIDINPRHNSVIKGDIKNCGFSDASFDIVTSCNLFDNGVYRFQKGQRGKMLSEIHRILKPSGTYIFWEGIEGEDIIGQLYNFSRRANSIALFEDRRVLIPAIR